MAVWSRRFGVFAVVLLLVGTLAHRARLTEEWAGPAVLALVFAFGAVALLLGIAALVRIWVDGFDGARQALLGILCGAAVLTVPAAFAPAALRLPRLAEASTDLDNPPPFAAAIRDRPRSAPPVAALDPELRTLQPGAYPTLAALRVEAPAAEVHAAALELVRARGWRVLEQQPPEAPAPPPTAPRQVPPPPVRGRAAAAAPPPPAPAPPVAVRPPAPGRIEAVARTRLYAFSDDVVIRIVRAGAETVVDMRSASRLPLHDLGANARRITAFLDDLRDRVGE